MYSYLEYISALGYRYSYLQLRESTRTQAQTPREYYYSSCTTYLEYSTVQVVQLYPVVVLHVLRSTRYYMYYVVLDTSLESTSLELAS